MGIRGKKIEAYQKGVVVGEQLVEAAIASVLQEEETIGVELTNKENFVLKLLCAAGKLHELMVPVEYIAMLPCFFRTLQSNVPADLLYRVQQGDSKETELFALGASFGIESLLDAWDDWLYDCGYISRAVYELRLSDYDDEDEDEDQMPDIVEEDDE